MKIKFEWGFPIKCAECGDTYYLIHKCGLVKNLYDGEND